MAKLINPYTECGLPRHLPPRWHVALVYRTRSGLLEIEHDIEELFELDDLVEHGPHWDTLTVARITLNRPTYRGLTVEESELFTGEGPPPGTRT
jgi:hypothetical protein